ncbi:NADPH-dependent FMN reductase [Mollicutes bacterium LVI A0039]|nr:NADPH-dependent FMN reductase [Mollicutes bacterium LVI A0039]
MKTIIASNSQTSINEKVAKQVNERIDLNIIEINKEEIPMYSPEVEAMGFPLEIQKIYDLLKDESKLIIFTPEYNGYTTPYFKNIFDWLSRINHDFLKGVEVKIITVTPGKMGGASVRKILSESLPFFGAINIETYGVTNYFIKLEEDALDKDVENIYELVK